MGYHTDGEHLIDLEIRIFPGNESAAGYPVEITLGGQQEFPRGYLSADILPWTSSSDPVGDGQRLFDALFADNALRSAWAEARGQSPQRRIRLRIDANAPELHALPWELLHEGDTMLAANADTPFSRYLAVAEPWGGAVEERPIRVLAVVSAPKDLEDMYNLAPLDRDVEQAILEEAFFALDENDIELSFLHPPATLERIEEALQSGYHILHYVGHGMFNQRREQAALYLQDEEGDTECVRDNAFIKMLARQRQDKRPRLIFLAACQSATRSTANAFLGLGPKLVNAGVPAVVAMQDFVAIKTARKLSLAFYRRLAEHGMVDCALNEARSTLLTTGRPDAAVPVLFMRLKPGQLWEAETKTEAEADQAAAGPQIPPPPEPTSPPEVPGFVGRETELAALTQKLAQTNLAVITGMPGVGKTALASVLAQRVADPKKTFWHTFYPDEGLEGVIWKLAGFLYWHDHKDLWEMLQRAVISGGKLPPTRDLLDYAAQLLRQSGYTICLNHLQFLSDEDTTRLGRIIQQLHPEGVTFILASQVAPAFVSLSEIEPLAGLSAEDAHRLLVARDMALPEELEAQVYARTEGNPQLLTLSTHILKRASDPAKILERLAAVEDMETYLVQEVDEGLSEDDREVMVATAILLGYPGTRDAIETVADRRRIKRLILHLSHQHLLQAQQGEEEEEYTEHTILREFYYGVPSRRERQEMHGRAAEFYVEEEPPDILKAALHYERAREYERAVELATKDIWAIINRGQARPLGHLLEQFQEQQLNPELWARVNIARGEIHTFHGESQLAQESYHGALSQLDTLADTPQARELKARACQGMGDLIQFESSSQALDWLRRGLDELAGASTQEEAALHIKIGIIQIDMGEFTAALHSLEQGLGLLPKSPSRLRATALLNIGNIHAFQGDMARSSEYTQQALEISEHLYDHFRMAAIWHNMGIDHEIAGQWDQATGRYQEALALARRLGSAERQAGLELSLGTVRLKQAQDETARMHLENCLALARDHDLKMYLIWGNSSLADLHLRQGEPEAATPLLAEAEHLAQEADMKDPLPEIYREWAQVHLANTDPQAALTYAERSINLAGELDMKMEEGTSLRVLGQALIANTQHEPAVDAFQRSLSLLADQDPYEVARTKMEWGRCLVAGREAERGMALLHEARTTFQELGAQRDLAAVDQALHGDS